MSSAAPPAYTSQPTTPALLREVRELYRRVCVLRAAGKTTEAEALFSGELASAIARGRTSGELADSQLPALFATEEDRVDTAHTVADILRPYLSTPSIFPAVQPPLTTGQLASEGSRAGLEGALQASRAPTPVPTGRGTNSSPAGIADFIDEMLTQDRSPSSRTGARRPT